MESKEPGEIGEDGNEVVDLQGKTTGYKHTSFDVQQKKHGSGKPKEAADERNNDGVDGFKQHTKNIFNKFSSY